MGLTYAPPPNPHPHASIYIQQAIHRHAAFFYILFLGPPPKKNPTILGIFWGEKRLNSTGKLGHRRPSTDTPPPPPLGPPIAANLAVSWTVPHSPIRQKQSQLHPPPPPRHPPPHTHPPSVSPGNQPRITYSLTLRKPRTAVSESGSDVSVARP